MELVNECYARREAVSEATLRFATATAASLIFPFAPHCGADVYERLTGLRVWEEPWPAADPALLARDEVEIALQINGKLRDRMPAPASADREQLETLARDRPRVQAHIDGKDVVKVDRRAVEARQLRRPRLGARAAAGGRASRSSGRARTRRPAELAAAEEAGAAIAAAGATLVCGGLGGVMEAACRGARSRGGHDGRDAAGQRPRRTRTAGSCSRCRPGSGEARNALVVRAADAVVAIGGGWGTLSEIALRAAARASRCSAWRRGSSRAAARRSPGCGRSTTRRRRSPRRCGSARV